MRTKERLEELEDGYIIMIVGTRIDHMMTGTTRISIAKDGTIKLTYEDGQVESRKISDEMLEMDIDDISIFKYVGWVQDGRNLATQVKS